MNTIEIISLGLNLLLSGTNIWQFVFYRSRQRQASAEATGAELSNSDKLIAQYDGYIQVLIAEQADLKQEVKDARQEARDARSAEAKERDKTTGVYINSTSTYHSSKTTQLNLKDFIHSRGVEDILFSDITAEFGESFKLFLKREHSYSASHLNHCLCWLNRLIYIAVDQEILRANPLEDVEYEKKEPPKLRHISRNELKLLMETPMPNEVQELARRTLIFSSFTGLAYVDVSRLYPRHISRAADGRR